MGQGSLQRRVERQIHNIEAIVWRSRDNYSNWTEEILPPLTLQNKYDLAFELLRSTELSEEEVIQVYKLVTNGETIAHLPFCRALIIRQWGLLPVALRLKIYKDVDHFLTEQDGTKKTEARYAEAIKRDLLLDDYFVVAYAHSMGLDVDLPVDWIKAII